MKLIQMHPDDVASMRSRLHGSATGLAAMMLLSSLLQSPEPVLDVCYAWSDGGNWQASKCPRFWLTENLYKIQVAGPVGNESQRPCRDFLKEFLPHVEQVIQ